MSIIIKMGRPIESESHLKKAIDYVMQEWKTEGRAYSNSGITPVEIKDTFFLTKKVYPSHGKRQGYHWKFSFSKDEMISHDEALEFIREWAEEYLGEEYDFVVAEHSDRELTHMHLIFNSVRRGGGKYHYGKDEWDKVIKPLTNRICDKYHTGHVKEKDKDLDYAPERNWKAEVEEAIDECIKASKSYSDFKIRLQRDFHYSLREGVSKDYGVYLSLKPPGKAKAIRSYRLSPGYMPEDIERKITESFLKEIPETVRINLERKENTKALFCVIFRQEKELLRSGYFRQRHIPYKDLSAYQQYFVRRMLSARRLYHRTGTTLKGHEQSVRAIHSMMHEVGELYKYNIRTEHRLSEEIFELKKQITFTEHRLSEGKIPPEQEADVSNQVKTWKKELTDLKRLEKQKIPEDYKKEMPEPEQRESLTVRKEKTHDGRTK
ncbi:MAG: relaxase/mobilization nuclease domain-containing protein [Roseburia sp.]|nr:relaxase/mobilization nuclease domain-containing protein [Roseburia sp.]